MSSVQHPFAGKARRNGIETSFQSSADGWVVQKLCSTPGSGAWFRLLAEANSLQLGAERFWVAGRGDGLVPLLALEQGLDRLSLRLAYIPGDTLRVKLSQGWSEPVSRLILRMARVLRDLHRRGVVHGDLKPENWIVTPDEELVLIDPGWSWEHPQQSEVSVAYAAPEVLGYLEARVSAASDLYSLGKLWAEFGAPSPAERPILKRLLANDPRQRYQKAEHLIVDLELGSSGLWPLETQLAAVPLAGREAQLVRLRRAARGAAQGLATWVAVYGNSGIGKSRLISEFAQETRFRVLWGGCYQGESKHGWQALHEALSQLVPEDLVKPLDERLLGQIQNSLPGLVRLGGKVNGWSGSRASFLDSFAENLNVLLDACSSAERPLLLVLDDLQWARAETLEMLKVLSTYQQGYWLVCCCCRSEKGMRLSGHFFDSLELGPLTEGDCRDIARSAGQEGERLDPIIDWSNGNPFFLLEMLRHSDAADISVGERALPWLQARFDRLPDASKLLLSLAALMGKRFVLGPLEILGWEPELLKSELERAAQDQILWLQDEVGVFCHDHLRERALELMAPEAAGRLHYQLAGYYLRTDPYDKARIGHHLRLSHQPRRSLAFLVSAARSAMGKQQFSTARNCWEAALELQDDLDWHVECHSVEISLGLFAEAEARLLGLKERFPAAQGVIQYHFAQLRFDQGDYHGAVQALKTVDKDRRPPRTITELPRAVYRLFFTASDNYQMQIKDAFEMFIQLDCHRQQKPTVSGAIFGFLLYMRHHQNPSAQTAAATWLTLIYHAGPTWIAHLGGRWLQPRLSREPSLAAWAPAAGTMTTMELGAIDRKAARELCEEAHEILVAASDHWQACMAFLVRGFFWQADGYVRELAQESERVLSSRQKMPLLKAIAEAHYCVSHGTLPPSFGEVEPPSSDQLTNAHRLAALTQRAILNGDFESAMPFRAVPHFTLIEVIHCALWATCARSAAESLPRSAARKREELIASAEEAVARALTRSRRFLLYHGRVLRERALLFLLRGDSSKCRAGLAAALEACIEGRLPLEELHTRREWVRVGRLLDWPEVGEHEAGCVRLARRLGCNWLLPAQAQLLPDLPQLAVQASELLEGRQRGNGGEGGHILAQTPEWSDFWSRLQQVVHKRELETSKLQQRKNESDDYERKWDQLWSSRSVLLAQLGSDGEVERCSPAFEGHSGVGLERLEVKGATLKVGALLPTDLPEIAVLQSVEKRQTAEKLMALFENLSPMMRQHTDFIQPDSVSPEQLFAHFARRGLKLEMVRAFPVLPELQERVVLLVLRELLTNALKYSPARVAELSWHKSETAWIFQLSNPVSPEACTRQRPGLGLNAARYRLRQLDGRLTLTVAQGQAQASLQIPV